MQLHRTRSLFFLICANIIPLVGVLFFEWSLFSVLFSYWAETIVVGILNVPKMIMAKGMDKKLEEGLVHLPESKRDAAYLVIRIFTVPFFVFHFGAFTLVHGVFVFIMYGPSNMSGIAMMSVFFTFFVSHGYSFVKNFVGNQEYLTRSVKQQMGQPYKRVVILQMAVVFSAFPLFLFNKSFFPVLILIVLKTSMDAFLHMNEHARGSIFNFSIKSR
jgi:hypothetical protein